MSRATKGPPVQRVNVAQAIGARHFVTPRGDPYPPIMADLRKLTEAEREAVHARMRRYLTGAGRRKPDDDLIDDLVCEYVCDAHRLPGNSITARKRGLVVAWLFVEGKGGIENRILELHKSGYGLVRGLNGRDDGLGCAGVWKVVKVIRSVSIAMQSPFIQALRRCGVDARLPGDKSRAPCPSLENPRAPHPSFSEPAAV